MSGLGYLYDHRHFLKLPLTKKNCSILPPGQETDDLKMISDELISLELKENNFEVVKIKEVKLKNRKYMIYILKDAASKKGCGCFIDKGVVKSIHLKGYKFKDPYNNNDKRVCRDIKDALSKNGELKEKSL